MDRIKRHAKIRQTIKGTAERPRLAVYRSLNNVFAQLIDDQSHKTIISASSLKVNGTLGTKAKEVGETIAKNAQTAKITTVLFDRGGFPYSGVVKILAEAARNGGLKF